MTTLPELAAQVAELAETVSALREQVATNALIAVEVRELLKVLRDQKHETTVNVPPAPPPPTPAAPRDVEIVHEWEGNRIVRSAVTHKRSLLG